ncbi:MAG: sugar ABC transporter ATP-binding protein [Ferruginibacter sp.]
MLIAKNITKKFSGVTALNNICLELHPGKVNAIIGENGAGKSTLMKIFSGVHTQYEGSIIYNDQELQFAGTKEAEQAGIAIIHQELNLIPHLTISENIFLGRELTNAFGMLDKKTMRIASGKLLEKLNLTVSPDTKIAELKVGQQQLVEIAKALFCNAAVIIMDEPTSAISDKEVDNLFSIIAELKSQDKTIVYISHKLKELFTIADRYIVLRDGCTIESGDMEGVSQESLIHKMTGRKIELDHRTAATTDTILLQVNNLTLKKSAGLHGNVLSDISFSLFEGEILGIYGLMGAGRTELMESIFGLYPKLATAEIIVGGLQQKIKAPADAIKAGIALVPEDRKLQGLSLGQNIKTNISITILSQLQKWGFVLNHHKEVALSKKYINELGIKTSSEKTLAKNLSGGNQQKIVLAKWLATKPRILLLDEPTRGIDVNAKAEIYKLMKTLAAQGMGIIMVSSELPEIFAVSDRILVMAEGELTANIPVAEATEAVILKHAIHKN